MQKVPLPTILGCIRELNRVMHEKISLSIFTDPVFTDRNKGLMCVLDTSLHSSI